MFLDLHQRLSSAIKHRKHYLNADDLKIYILCSPDSISEAIERLNADILAISRSSAANGLKLNLA